MAVPPETYNFERDDPFVAYETPSAVPYNPARLREVVRTALVAVLAFSTFGALLAIVLATAFGEIDPDNAAKAGALMSPVVGAAILAVGFYFREPH